MSVGVWYEHDKEMCFPIGMWSLDVVMLIVGNQKYWVSVWEGWLGER